MFALPKQPSSPSKNNQSVIFFDIDGTLLLTRSGRSILSEVFHRQHGVPGAFDDVDFSGRTDPLIIHKVAEDNDVQLRKDQYESLCDDYYQRLCLNLDGNVQIMPGVPELIRRLHSGSIRLGLITGNNHRGASIKLNHVNLTRFFEGGAFGEDGPERQAIVNTALERFSVNP
ncbi:MAG: HAD family hydrolase, partial [bacterium]